MTGLPSGTFTFVFTDIEGSTRLLRELGDAYVPALRAHDVIIRNAATAHGGRAFGSEGDAQNLVFDDPHAAIAAAADSQRGLTAYEWPEGHPVRARMGVHTGQARSMGADFVGMSLHETARIASAGHGGQVLVSAATFELTRDALPEGTSFRDLGEHGLKDMGRPMRIYQLDVEGSTRRFPALRTTGSTNIDLPTQVTSFVRRPEVEAVSQLVGQNRLVTLSGPGGTGKTRLAIAAAGGIAHDFGDGVHFVALDSVSDAGLVGSEIATTLGLAGNTDEPLGRVIDHLRDRRVLLVIDNVEQVIDAASDIAAIVEGTQHVHVVATSRIPLGVYGEQEFPVPGLTLPPSDADISADDVLGYGAVALFVERARAARPDFALGDGDAARVAGIVTRLDGLPLAIELAAARLRMLPLSALRERIEDSLSVVGRGGRDRPTRQQTLRGAIAWSHDLLDEPDRRLFARYGAIAGSSTLVLVEAVCGPADEIDRDIFEGVESLASQSLLRLVDGGSEPRFGMLATIREYAVEQLEASDEAEVIRRRHAEAFLALAEEGAPALLGKDGKTWNDRLEEDHDDLRAAIDWSVTAGDADLAMRLITALWRFWQVRGHLVEGQDRARRVLSMPGIDSVAPAVRARAEGAAGGIAYWRADAAVYDHYRTALEFARQTDDRALLAEALYDHGFTVKPGASIEIAAYVDGKPFFEEALGIYRELGDRAGESSALWTLHQAALGEGDVDAGVDLGVQALTIARELDDPFRTGWAAYTLALGYATIREWAAALDAMRECFEMFVASGDSTGTTMAARGVALLATMLGVVDDGWRLIGATARVAFDLGAELTVSNAGVKGFDFRDEPETDAERAHYDEGHALSDDEMLGLARVVADLTEEVVASRGISD